MAYSNRHLILFQSKLIVIDFYWYEVMTFFFADLSRLFYINSHKWLVYKCNVNASVLWNVTHAHIDMFLHESSTLPRTKNIRFKTTHGVKMNASRNVCMTFCSERRQTVQDSQQLVATQHQKMCGDSYLTLYTARPWFLGLLCPRCPTNNRSVSH